MAKHEPKQQVPLVTERTRKPREGFKNPNRGIPVAEGLNLQDVPRDLMIRFLKENEMLAKRRFQEKYGNMGGVQSF
jgi:hypothetical protein